MDGPHETCEIMKWAESGLVGRITNNRLSDFTLKISLLSLKETVAREKFSKGDCGEKIGAKDMLDYVLIFLLCPSICYEYLKMAFIEVKQKSMQ